MILLVTCFPWDDAQGGAFILRHWARRLDSEPIHWFSLSKPCGRMPFDAPHVTAEFRSAPAFGNVRLRLRKFWRWYERCFWSARSAALMARRIKELQPRVVWLVADFGLVPVGLRLLPALRGRRVHVSIHDDLLATAQREGSSAGFMRETDRFLRALQELPLSADAVSEELLADTAPNSHPSAIVTMPADLGRCSPQFLGPRRDGPLLVGFSGNFFGEAEVACFVKGLQLWSQRRGVDWRFKVFGRENLGRLDPRIEARGFTPPEEVRAALSACDLLLLPSPLERPEMRTNMPTKLVSYLELGRMIFTFAPEGSSTQRVVKEAHLGPVVTVLDSSSVVDALDRLYEWDLIAAEAGWTRLLEDRFSEKRILQDLRAAILT